ncbi:MAG: hypothetical protein Ct9H90mP13_06160 [Pseudomonadota bacterium]|nr:MAG: hypothetical protein Ct9H90mP13_06160 [Pseudomonadota bacterium]
MIAIRSESVIASSWSCVTITKVIQAHNEYPLAQTESLPEFFIQAAMGSLEEEPFFSLQAIWLGRLFVTDHQKVGWVFPFS